MSQRHRGAWTDVRTATLCLLLGAGGARLQAAEAGPAQVDASQAVSALVLATDHYFLGLLRPLKVLAATEALKAADWDRARPLLSELPSDREGLTWFALPDGSCYTLKSGPMAVRLNRASFFGKLLAGDPVLGEPDSTRLSGDRAVVVAVPVKREAQVVAMLGIFVYVEAYGRRLEERLAYPPELTFYALDPRGCYVLHRDPKCLFGMPGQQSSGSLGEAARQMLATPQGYIEYEVGASRTNAVYKRSPLTGWVCVLGVQTAAPGAQILGSVTGADPLSRIQASLNSAFEHMDAELARTAEALASVNLATPRARGILRKLAAASPYAMSWAIISRDGKALVYEPSDCVQLEGSDLSQQQHVIRGRATKEPLLSEAFKAVEGFEAVVLQHPILGPGGALLGFLCETLKPSFLLANVAAPVLATTAAELWAMQTDGRVLHDADADEIGLKLFEAPLYAPYLNLLTLGRRIAAEPEGTGTYEFLATGTHKEATREAAWVTAGLHGTEWRLVLTREVTPAR